ncbi:hypothetical protein LEP1GSC124_0575 [Leptospira interrogans serovar Pyrogenes str. 200701872]|uniref:Uncharacterized protein n=1 Tax=Leptospira interrogans serovar Pyrogenes str. 200701872 TaxID=1193029 RepID=M6ZUK5_LEPIR|nr:hypothetical protein LEP1GSC124_0575 [Leptospira interrogans serovar Pyrogenes str. 200701872]
MLVLYQFLRNQIKYDLGIEFIYMKKLEYMVLAYPGSAFCKLYSSVF